jgi:hypothetical protein
LLHRGAASYVASLAARVPLVENHPAAHEHARQTITVQTSPVRITHRINGRPYVIEVRAVGRDRWRAQVAKRAGGTTSLMPFYGKTPDDAAALLAGWLKRASEPRKAV